MDRRHFVGAIGATAAASAVPFSALAQSGSGGAAQGYPNKPVRMILPIGAGGVADAIMRVVTDKVTQSNGAAYVLDNRAGAGGNIGMDLAARAAPDGYTLLYNGPSFAINPWLYKKLSFDPVKDFVPVAVLGIAPFAVFITGKLPVNNLSEFIAYAKANPGKLNYASIGAGSAAHLSSVMFTSAAGIEMIHVPYKNVQQASVDLVAGGVHLMFNSYPPLSPMIEGGRLKMLGFSSARRLPAYPDIPTLSESGLPGFESGGWYIVAVPAGTPREIQQRINTDFNKAIALPEVRDAVTKLGFDLPVMSLEETQKFYAREYEKWGKAVRTSGATAD